MESNQIPIENRVRFLDALRGIAVLCIYLSNIAFFSGYLFFKPEECFSWATLPSDDTLDFICFTLVDGKFYTIFSLLFGIGCAVQYERLSKRRLAFRTFFARRMFWLLVIGATHLCLFWTGDILTLYALLGFLLLFLVEIPGRKLLPIAVVLLLIPILNHIFTSLIFDYPQFFRKLSNVVAASLGVADKSNPVGHLTASDWTTFFKINLSAWPVRVARILDEGRAFKVMAVFLIGLWAGRKIFRDNLLGNTRLLGKVAVWGIAIGLPLCAFRSYIEFFKYDAPEPWPFIKTVIYAFGTVPLALGFTAALALLYRRKPNLLSVFEPVGKMALTNYLLQTLISIVIFYGLGFGLAGKFGYTFVFVIALSVYALEMAFSAFWLRCFSQGPMEWLWRRAVKTGKNT